MNGGVQETKSEIRARLDELERLVGSLIPDSPHASFSHSRDLQSLLVGAARRRSELEDALRNAQEDLSAAIIKSHRAICDVKQMDEKEAYGNDPAVYYTLGVCGEAGEMANAIVKAQRNGHDRERVLEAVKSELPDVIIYSYVLAHVLDIDLSKLVNEKVDVVVHRAYAGYYGAPLRRPVHPRTEVPPPPRLPDMKNPAE